MPAINWTTILQQQGFDTVKEMFTVLYERYDSNIILLSQYLGLSQPTIRKYLLKTNVVSKMPKPGTHPGKYTCRWCNKIFVGDTRQVCCSDPVCLAKNKVYLKGRVIENIKNKRKKPKSFNTCKICGKDKGLNRWFCNHCLQYIDAGVIGEGL